MVSLMHLDDLDFEKLYEAMEPIMENKLNPNGAVVSHDTFQDHVTGEIIRHLRKIDSCPREIDSSIPDKSYNIISKIFFDKKAVENSHETT